MKNQTITFVEKNKALLLTNELSEELKPDEVLVKTEFSTVSVGTERANVTGERNTIWLDENAPAVFPRVSGYSSSGVVINKGETVTDLEVGDRVIMTWSSHSKYNRLNKSNVIKMEGETPSFSEAALFHIATFPLAAIRKVGLEIGESMLVMGAGILGLMAVKLSKCAGAVPIVVVDPNPERRAKALLYGADYALDPTEENFVQKVKDATDGGAKCAIEVTGIGAGLNQCLDCMRQFGRIALLGCTRDKNFTVDYYKKVHGPGITIVGAHTNARPKWESHAGWFTLRDDIKTVYALCKTSRMTLADMVDEIHSPAECEEVYNRVVFDKNFPCVVQFDWNKLD